MKALENDGVEHDRIDDEAANDLYRRLLTFKFDEPGTELTFAARLARDNGWSARFANRVIDEYKRFALLAVVAGQPVCPSDEVDEAWHLHLTCTRSYWHGFCALLGRPLHHQPTKGGPAELKKHMAMYERALASYRRVFGYDPPADIWPAASERFWIGRGHRRVDLNRHWVIPKPQLRKLGAVFMAAGAAGPAAGMIANPFDFDGPTFLVLYAILLMLAVPGAFFLRQTLRSGYAAPVDESINPYEAAYLAGGKRLAIRAAIASLVDRGALVVRKVEKKLLRTLPVITEYRLVSQGLLGDDAPTLEKAICNAAAGEGQTVPKLHEAVDSHAGLLAARLQREGLMLDDEQSAKARWWPTLLVASLAAMGVIKIAVGVHRDRPVGLLIAMVLITLAVGACFLKNASRSRAGDQILNDLRHKHAKLNVAAHGPAHDMPSSDLVLATALFGTAVLMGGPLDELRAALMAPKNQGGGGGSVGCGSGCGSGCAGGGGCGGGGCGGGCGGCS